MNVGDIQMNPSERDLLNSFKSGHKLNPLEKEHIAHRTDDIDAFMSHLDLLGIHYSDWGSNAVNGWHQVFFYDPDGIVIEIHQVLSAEK